MTINTYQRIMLDAYAYGEYGHVVSAAEAERTGDTLFLFLFRELSSQEDCIDIGIARKRMVSAIGELKDVLDALQEAAARGTK